MPNDKWTVRGGGVLNLAPFRIMGIVNVTPDSFSDGGEFFEPDAALRRAGTLLREGAAILDLGGESTRPGAAPVSAAEERRRLLPVIAELAARRENGLRGLDGEAFLISVDTWRSDTAAACLEAGADIINDIAGGLFDPDMAEVLAHYRPGYILGHCPEKPATMQRAPHYENVVEEVYAWLAEQAERFARAGLPQECICLDPCPGFGKNLRHNLELLRDLMRGGNSRLLSLGLPVCLAVSRKSMLCDLLNLPRGPARREEKDAATQIMTALLLQHGLYLHRVHAVAGARRAALLQAALAGEEPEEGTIRG